MKPRPSKDRDPARTPLSGDSRAAAPGHGTAGDSHRRRVQEQMAALLPVLRRRVRACGKSLAKLEGEIRWRRGYLSQILRGTIYLKAHQLFTLAETARFDEAVLLQEVFGGREPPPNAPAESDRAESDPAESDQAESDQAESDQAESDQAESDQAESNRADDGQDDAGQDAAEIPREQLLVTLEELIARWLESERRRRSAGASPDEELAAAGSDPRAVVAEIRRRSQARSGRLREHLRRTILDHGVSLQDLSSELGWGTGTIYTALSERVQVTLPRLLEVLSSLGADPGRFFAEFFAAEAEEDEETRGSRVRLDPRVGETLRELLDSLAADLPDPPTEGPLSP